MKRSRAFGSSTLALLDAVDRKAKQPSYLASFCPIGLGIAQALLAEKNVHG
jgi:hypothetical protein